MSVVTINLLPYRDAKIVRRKSEFSFRLVLFIILGLLLAALLYLLFNARILAQNERNARLQTELTRLEITNKEVLDLQKDIDALNNRLNAVEVLRKNRDAPVKVFHELVNNGVTGFYIEKLEKKDDEITFEGGAVFAKKVSELLSSMDADGLFVGGRLLELVAKDVELPTGQKKQISTFKIVAQLNANFSAN